MKILSQAQMGMLMDIEDKYSCDFYLPPIHDKLNCCFYDISKIKNNAIKFRKFMLDVKKVEVKHKFVDINGKKFMAVMR